MVRCVSGDDLFGPLICAELDLGSSSNAESESMYTRKLTHRLGATLVAVAMTLPAFGQADKIDAYVRSEMRTQKIPGLALAIVRNGEIVKAQGYGLANVELGVPVKPETIFQSGSVGKQFTATLVMMLVEEGKLRLDDPIGNYLPGSPKSWRGITLRHLLSHTGGSWQGFRAAVSRYPDQGLTVVVFANLDAADPDEIAHEVAALVDDELAAE